MRKFTVLGLMSGTSIDGLDCGIFDISLSSDYKLYWSCIEFITFPYSEEIRQSIYYALKGDKLSIEDADNMLGEVFSAMSEEFIGGREIDLIATHGQTVSHDDGVSSLQIGDPTSLSEKLNVPVVYNVRHADIVAGGTGAPLMPFLDWLLFKDIGKDIITLNLGGMANLSFIPKSGKQSEVLGFDTGPGMALIDECCMKFYCEPIDINGVYSTQGNVNDALLVDMLTNTFIHKQPPKSTGRHEFGKELVNSIIQEYPQTPPCDLIRTFCAFTAKSIAENMNKFLNINVCDICLIVSGGGVNHPILMQDIKKYTQISNINISDTFGIKSDMKEALLMAVIGVARKQEMTSNIPSVTGAIERVVLGDLVQS